MRTMFDKVSLSLNRGHHDICEPTFFVLVQLVTK